MKKITLLTLLLVTTLAFGQYKIDMTEALGNINGHLAIDGNALQVKYNTKDQIIITGADLVINHRSSFIFNNVIVQLSGDIVVNGDVKASIIDSYVFCKKSGSLKSKKIIQSNNYADVVVGEVEYIKNLPDDSEIWLYNPEGKRIFKGTKEEAFSFRVPISRYDVKVVGHSFKDKVLFN